WAWTNTAPGLFHWDGQAWTDTSAGLGTDYILDRVLSRTEAWAYTGPGTTMAVLMRWDGTQWTPASPPELSAQMPASSIHEFVSDGSGGALAVNFDTSSVVRITPTAVTSVQTFAADEGPTTLSVIGAETYLGTARGLRVWNGQMFVPHSGGLTSSVYGI